MGKRVAPAKAKAATKRKPATRSGKQKRLEEINLTTLIMGLSLIGITLGLMNENSRLQNMLIGASLLVMALALAAVAVKVWYYNR